MSKIKASVKTLAAMATVATASLVYSPAFAKPSDKATSGLNKVNNKTNATTDLEGSIGLILNTVYAVIGIVAVVMIILGGVSYATSQGDAGKVKKGKDTIMYGIIGLIIVLLAFAITNFVLTNIDV